MRGSWRGYVRVVWAIAAKDMVDALKNKTILSGLVTVAFVVVLYKALPLLTEADELPYLMVYDEGESALAFELEDSPSVSLRTHETREDMIARLTASDNVTLGLVLPAGLDGRLAAGEGVTLEAYAAYWLAEDRVAELAQTVEDEITFLSGAPVRVAVDGRRAYPADPGKAGSGFMVSITVVMVLLMAEVITGAYLMLEEKQTRTLDALLVSPASPTQVLLGKAAVGMAYGLIGVGMVYALNGAYIVAWWVAILAAVLGALFGAALGGLVGSLCDSRAQVTLYGFMVMSGLLLPAFMVDMAELFPAPLGAIARWVPTSGVAWLVRASFAPTFPAGGLAVQAALVAGSTVALAALAKWRIGRLEG